MSEKYVLFTRIRGKLESREMDNYSSSKKQKLNDDEMMAAGTSSSSSSVTALTTFEENISMQNLSNSNRISFYEVSAHNERLGRWQERQFARCIDENTINRVIELYLRIFHEVNSLSEPVTIPQIPQPIAIASTSSNSANSGLEESAILMAISEHGLQQNIEPTVAVELPIPQVQIIDESLADPLDSNCCFPDNDDDGFAMEDDTDDSPPPVDSPDLNSSNESEEHIDFMEAAVAAAIQKKGLAPFAISMSPTR